ncbi:MAG TPA: PQQ-binding-like beta-propeller repeat protein, partial [Fimbriimonadaceae bacterium]|nr:PQQ-binding-like beta-propeller repeat protein [Fimbriimonadaceae bacterium]
GQEGATGQYVASPVVGEIQAIAPSGAPEAYTRRVVSARNEDSFIGLLNRQVSVGVLSSFTHNGLDVFDPTFTGRKNLVWSWPFKRPFGNSTAEIDRAASDKQAWVTGPNAANSRAFQRIQVDNRNGSSTSSGLFVPDNTIIPHIGEDYMNAPGTFGGALSAVTWAPTLPEGGYTIQVWLPTASPSNNLATSAVYQVLSGGTVIDTIEVDQSAGNGWLTFSGQPADGYPNSAKAPLSFRVTDHVNKAADAGRTVYADAVRFVRNSDLSITSTPVQTRATMTLPGGATAVRDVIVAATEDGKIYCMDAHGDPTTGDPPQLYWVYPSADPATDPNHVQAEDGLDGMAEMPTGFDMSSALVENVGGVDLLYIGSKNGRVYCLEMGGRGDGTTRRRWTFPDDYNPTLPAAQIAPSALGQIVGSVAFGPGGGTPTIYVPTSQGRVYALDAAGDPVSKTTTVRWQFPDAASLPIGAVNMTPAVAFGNVYFGAGTSTSPTAGAFYAVDEATGTMVWQSLTTPSGPFVRFDRSSPVVVPGAQITGGGPFAGIDTVFFVDQSGRFVSLNAATGAFQWETSEIGSASIGSPIFTYQTVFNNASVLQADVPVVVVPSTSGRLVSLLADGSVNVAGRREVWGYTLDGDTLFASPASGGKNLVEAHSWLYVGDNKGTFYAFNHDPALPDTGQIIPPNGQVPPGNDESQDNDGASQ